MSNSLQIWNKTLAHTFANDILPHYSILCQAIKALTEIHGLSRTPSERSARRALRKYLGKSPRYFLGRALQPSLTESAPTPESPDHSKPSPLAAKRDEPTFAEQLEILLDASPKPLEITDKDEGDVAILAISDTHWGSASADVSRRIQGLPNRILPYLKGSVRRLHLLLLGDIIDGDGIYPGQCWDVDMPAPAQWIMAVEQLWSLMLQLNSMFPLTLIAQPGNHGAMGHKKSDKHPMSNFDVLAYSTLKLLANKTGSNIKVVCSSSPHYHLETIGGKTVYIRHKAPPQYATPARQNKGRGWAKIHKFDMMFFGHVHHWGVLNVDGIPIFRVGTVRGANDFSDEIAQFDYPSCTLVRFHPARFPEHTAIQLPWID